MRGVAGVRFRILVPQQEGSPCGSAPFCGSSVSSPRPRHLPFPARPTAVPICRAPGISRSSRRSNVPASSPARIPSRKKKQRTSRRSASRRLTRIDATAARRSTSNAPTTTSGGISASASPNSRRSSSTRPTVACRRSPPRRSSASPIGGTITTTRRSVPFPNAAFSDSTRGRRWCRAPTTTTCRSCRRPGASSSSTR